MAANDERLRIAAHGTSDNYHAHFDPIVSAELAWGNRIARDWHLVDPKVGGYELTLAYSFHVELLKKTFRFPPNITLGVVGSESRVHGRRMSMGDKYMVGITAPFPKDWPAGDGRIEL